MLKRLKRRMVLINMLLAGIILVLVSGVAIGLIYRFELNKINDRLSKAIYFFEAESDYRRDFGDGFGKVQPFGGTDGNRGEIEMDKGDFINGTAVAVLLDENGEIIVKTEFSAKMSQQALEYSVQKALSSGKDTGYIREVRVNFMKKQLATGTCVAFTDRTDLNSAVKITVIMCVAMTAALLCIFLVISIILANLAVRPVKESWETRKQFIADASHELKTPITVILANSNILDSKNEDPEKQQWIDSTRDEAEKMQKLVEQMLYLAKSDADGYKVVKGDVNVSELAEQTCLCFEPVAFEHGVEISTAIMPDVRLNTDGTMLERVFGVLLDNAVKHAAPGTAVRFALGKADKKVEIFVNNTGDVIDPEDLPHVFDRFFKADKARTNDSASDGFGLGLSIAHDIVEKLGGTITAASSEEYGTTFRVSF